MKYDQVLADELAVNLSKCLRAAMLRHPEAPDVAIAAYAIAAVTSVGTTVTTETRAIALQDFMGYVVFASTAALQVVREQAELREKPDLKTKPSQ